MVTQTTPKTEGYGDVLPRIYVIGTNPGRHLRMPCAVWRLDVEEDEWRMARRDKDGKFYDQGKLTNLGIELVMRHFELMAGGRLTWQEIVDLSPRHLLQRRRRLEITYPGSPQLNPHSDNPFDPVPANFVS